MKALYLHVPFCEHICSYCDFARGVYQSRNVDKWLQQIQRDLMQATICDDVDTIYVGGGTPTCLSVSQLQTLLELLKPYTSKVTEYSVESNLESITTKKLELLKSYGVNRISLGVQSYHDDLLKRMNRKHLELDINPTIDLVHRYIDNITIDLIYGLPNQTIEVWLDTLNKATINQKINHISVYSLTIEENSVFGKQNIELIDNEIEATMYESAIQTLEQHGFMQYEIANFAKSGFESKHNLHYWTYDDFYGIGFGASGTCNGVRTTYNNNLKQYMEGIDCKVTQHLFKQEQMFEHLMMQLRLRQGLSLDKFEQRWSIQLSSAFVEITNEWILKGFMELNHGILKTTTTGMMYLHDILVSYMEVSFDGETTNT